MFETDREAFTEMLGRAVSTFKGFDKRQAGYWFETLTQFELPDIRGALVEYGRRYSRPPTPFNIIELIRSGRVDAGVHKQTSHPLTHWTASDLLVACNFASIDWTKHGGKTDWADRVVDCYDSAMAETCMRVIDRHKDKKPADAAREHLKEHPGWTQPVSPAVKAEQLRSASA